MAIRNANPGFHNDTAGILDIEGPKLEEGILTGKEL